jgi:hypothetical protein
MDAHVFQAPLDDISGIALRLEISRQYKLETLSYDYLAGAGVVRRELGSRSWVNGSSGGCRASHRLHSPRCSLL